VIIGNTCQLKQISAYMPRLARNNTDKIDADNLCQALKAQILSGVQQIVPVTLPPEGIQELRNLFSTYRLYQKQNTRLKNRIHSLPKEQLYGFTCEKIFDRNRGEPVQGFQTFYLVSEVNAAGSQFKHDGEESGYEQDGEEIAGNIADPVTEPCDEQ
jgi:hypothetical protein